METIFKIKKLHSANNKSALVELCNVHCQVIILPYSEVKEWFGVDKDNFSVKFEIEAGQKISAEFCAKTQVLYNVKFII